MHLLAKLEKSKSDQCKSITACTRDVFWHAFIKSRTWRTERLVKFIKGKIFAFDLLKPFTIENSLFTYKEPLLCLAASVFAKEFKVQSLYTLFATVEMLQLFEILQMHFLIMFC